MPASSLDEDDLSARLDTALLQTQQSSRVEEAAFYIKDALDGVIRVHPSPQDEWGYRCYRWRLGWYRYVRWMVLLVLVAISIMEQPPWCTPNPIGCQDTTNYPRSVVRFVSWEVTLPLELLCVLTLFLDFYLQTQSESQGLRWIRHRSQGFWHFLLLVVSLLNIFIAFTPVHWRVSACLAPIIRSSFFLLFCSSIRQELHLIWRIKVEFAKAVFMVSLVMIMYTIMAMVTFPSAGNEDRKEFTTFKSGLWNFFDLFLLSNFPNVMVESYSTGRGTQQLASCLIFFSFIVVAVQFLHNVILAIVVDAYDEGIEAKKAEEERIVREDLYAAFDCLTPSLEGVSDSRVIMALHATSKLPGLKLRRDSLEGVAKALDLDGDGWVTREDFTRLPGLLALAVQGEEEEEMVRMRARCQGRGYMWNTCHGIMSMLGEGRVLGHVIDALIILDVVLSLIKHSEFTTAEDVWETNHLLIILIAVLFVVEFVCKVYALGWHRYRQSYINCFDAFTTAASLVCGVVALAAHGPHDVIELFVLLRFLRLFRLLELFPMFHTLVQTFTTVLPSTINLILSLFLVIYFFGAYGVLAFGGKINSSIYPQIQTTQYYTEQLYLFNFNDFPTAVVVLLQLLFDSHMVVPLYDAFLLLGLAEDMGAYLFFYLAMANLILLNIVVALVLNAFLSEKNRARMMSIRGSVGGSVSISSRLMSGSERPSPRGEPRPYTSPMRRPGTWDEGYYSSPQRSVRPRESEEHKIAGPSGGADRDAIDL